MVGAAIGFALGAVTAWLIAIGGTPMQYLLSVDSEPLSIALHTLMAGLAGFSLSRLADLDRHTIPSLAVTGVFSGVLCWIAGPLAIGPMLRGTVPDWSSEAVVAAFPALITQTLMGLALGLSVSILRSGTVIDLRTGDGVGSIDPTRVVVLGGGFGGIAAVQELERQFATDPSVDITMVSATNAQLFTPMLAEVAGSALDGRHISSPLRAVCSRANVLRLRAEGIDVGMRSVLLRDPETNDITVLGFDHLVVALGAIPNFRGIEGLDEHAFTLKTLADANRLRNHVIRQLERADAETDRARRASLLTFVVAGGGFAGTETIAELNDLAQGVIRSYRRIDPNDLRFVLVHSRGRILPEIGDGLARYALESLQARGIEFVLGERVAKANDTEVTLSSGRVLATSTLVWTAGNQPNPLVATLPGGRDDAGRVIVDPLLRVAGLANVWVVGDVARVATRHEAEGVCPPTAQYAQRQGKRAGKNIAAVIRGEAGVPFEYKPKGTLVALGHRTAVAEIGGRRFAGLSAWLMWRGIYLAKLPGLEKRLRVLIDWLADLAFPRDTVITDVDTAAIHAPVDVTAARADEGPAS